MLLQHVELPTSLCPLLVLRTFCKVAWKFNFHIHACLGCLLAHTSATAHSARWLLTMKCSWNRNIVFTLLVDPFFLLKVPGVGATAVSGSQTTSSDDSNFNIFSSGSGDSGRDRQTLHLRDPSLVVNTWTGDFSSATARAWDVLRSEDSSVLDAVEQVGWIFFFLPETCHKWSIRLSQTEDQEYLVHH